MLITYNVFHHHVGQPITSVSSFCTKKRSFLALLSQQLLNRIFLKFNMLTMHTCTSIIYNLSFIALVVPKIVVVDPCNLGFF